MRSTASVTCCLGNSAFCVQHARRWHAVRHTQPAAYTLPAPIAGILETVDAAAHQRAEGMPGRPPRLCSSSLNSMRICHGPKAAPCNASRAAAAAAPDWKSMKAQFERRRNFHPVNVPKRRKAVISSSSGISGPTCSAAACQQQHSRATPSGHCLPGTAVEKLCKIAS